MEKTAEDPLQSEVEQTTSENPKDETNTNQIEEQSVPIESVGSSAQFEVEDTEVEDTSVEPKLATTHSRSDFFLQILKNHSLEMRDEKTGAYTVRDPIAEEREKFWSEFFYEEFHLEDSSKRTTSQSEDDDCIYFVKKINETEAEDKKEDTKGEKKEKIDNFFVRRRSSKANFPSRYDSTINWEETFFFNALLHHYSYTMEVSIREKSQDANSKSKLEVLKRVSKKVYATPSMVRLDLDVSKSDEVELTWPVLYFAVDDFDQIWKDVFIKKEGELVCVELFATGNFLSDGTSQKPLKHRIFAGALDYSTVNGQYKSRNFLWNSSTSQFFKLLGPRGRGAAQMAVTAQALGKDEREEAKKQQQQQQQQPAEAQDGGWKGLNAFNKLGTMFKTLTLSPSLSGGPQKLNCCLTYLNIRWDLLVKDLLANATKKKESKK